MRKLRVDWFAQRQSQGTAARWAPTERCTLGAFFFAGAHLRVLFCSLLFRHLRPFGNALHMNKHLGVVAALIFAGCSVEAESTLTARLRRVTTETPEFGGVRRTDSRAPVSSGTLTVFVRSAGSVANATAKVNAIFAPDLAPTISTRAATGAAAESNMLAAKDLLSVEGDSSLDFDETTATCASVSQVPTPCPRSRTRFKA